MRTFNSSALSILCLCASAVPAIAQVGDAEYVNATIARVALGIGSGDFDSDGHMDLISVSDESGRVVLFKGSGGGDFSTGTELLRGADLVGKPIFADFDLDGDLDVLLAENNFQTPEDFILLDNLGANGFQVTPIDLGFSVSVWSFEMHDYDQDGDLDIFLNNYFDVALIENLGGMNFAPPTTIFNGFGESIEGMAFGDFDNNGRDDLVLTTLDDYFFEVDLVYVAQDLNGAFGPPTVLAPNVSSFSAIIPIDLDNDGLLDFLHPGNGLIWYRNMGAAVLVAQPGSLANVPGIKEVHHHDVDLDGDLDLVCALDGPNPQTDRRIVDLMNNQDGTLTVGAQTSLVYWPPAFIAPADFDGDGRLDVAHTTRFSAQLFWASRGANGTYSGRKWITQRAGNDDFGAIDVNGDGLMDVVDVEVTQGEKTLSWFEQRHDGTFEKGVVTPISGFIPTGVEFADLEGDGHGDVIYAEIGVQGSPGRILVYPGGPIGFGAPVEVHSHPTAQQHNTPLAIDLDMDGDLDLVSCGSGITDIVAAYINLGNGNWSPQQTVDFLPLSTTIGKADFDGDGLVDMMVLGDFIQSPTVYLYRNLGNGGFAPKISVWSGSLDSESVAAADLDGDGDKELLHLVKSGNQTFVHWHENLGGFQFGNPAMLTELTPSNSFANYNLSTTDWDLDGKVDLLVLNESYDLVQWYRNLGGQTFDSPVTLTGEFQYSRAFQTVDMDGDLDQDILVADTEQLATLLYRNQTSLGVDVCSSAPNSSGGTTVLGATGSHVANVNMLRLAATDMPLNVFGYFLVGSDQGFVANPGGSDGNLCLGGAIGRYNQFDAIRFSGRQGTFALELDLTQTPTPTGTVAIMAGQSWYFQAWHRDQNPGPTSNFSNSLEVQFQ
ncbi:MAG: VCBS repeat-containing protein [Planctomycetota bacterium]|nr:VCBS repeat-containing protein [Planctomycetota bacterium]